MNHRHELSKISQITPNIFISGMYPIEDEQQIVNLGIKYMLCCVDRQHFAEAHDRIMINDPEMTILYLPYNDDNDQNLWKANLGEIQIIKYTDSIDDYNQITNRMRTYQRKPMIEIGYHFIDDVVSSGNNILIHCMAGMSRSVSLVAYYLMKKYRIDYGIAIKYIKERRRIANPNQSFRNQLEVYHKKRDKFTLQDAQDIINNIKKN